ncbi:RNA polymerase sigma factor [Caballeronia sp. LZ019]|uniref:RNA polymerase sigma factor n=1 Tax=Caballeronia sp. LZ019 TaxID=3038555 RepID=UPI00286740A8|nr:RNA polymerase sigma factor [Caballeronia sp. LZ019]MDR5806893.1 RNA polymerase sigma factor [Caballeronia sp. LZ019]
MTTMIPATDSTNDELAMARRIVAGDRAAFETMMRRHNRRLYRLARATLRNDAEAEDALQDAYLHAYRSMNQFRGDAQLFTWLSRLVLNECFARLRRSSRRQNVIPIVDAPDFIDHADTARTRDDAPDEALARAQVRALLERKLDELPELFRVVFVLRSIEEMSVEETAQCLNIPEATVRSRHFRARSLLRESLAQAFDLAERDVFEFGGSRCDRIVANVLFKLFGGAS